MFGKDLLQSRSFWGLVLVGAGMLAKRLGWDLDTGPATLDTLIQLLGLITSLVGTLHRSEPVDTIGGVPNPLTPKRPKF